MTDTLSISGDLSSADLKRLTRMIRSSTIGPTATYYAGVTAPVISAAVAIFSKTAFQAVALSAYWTFMLSAMLAAIAGIAWYLIFMRWSYRHTVGRGGELGMPTEIEVNGDQLVVRRGPIETRIGWDAVSGVHVRRGYLAVTVKGADALVVPDRWFRGDAEARKAFQARLGARGAG